MKQKRNNTAKERYKLVTFNAANWGTKEKPQWRPDMISYGTKQEINFKTHKEVLEWVKLLKADPEIATLRVEDQVTGHIIISIDKSH